MKVYKISEACPHKGAHLDEVVEYAIASAWGEKYFHGIREAKIVERDLDDMTDEESLAKGWLPLGQIRNGAFNDKDLKGNRLKPDTCSAVRMAHYLSEVVSDDEWDRWKPLLEATLRVDCTPTASPSDLSTIIKSARRSISNGGDRVFKWALKGVDAIPKYFTEGHIEGVEYLSPQKVLEDLIAENGIPDKRIVNRMRRLLQKSQDNINIDCIELSFVARAMLVSGVSEEDVFEWIRFGIDKMIQQCGLFFAAKDDISQFGLYYSLPAKNYEDKDIQLCVIFSNNPQMANASRSDFGREFGVALICNPITKNYSVTVDYERKLDMSGVVALIRLQELPESERKNADFEKFSQVGEIPEVPNWYMMERGTILNGSESHEVKPSRIKIKKLIDCIGHGLGPRPERVFNRWVEESLAKSGVSQLSKAFDRALKAT